MKNSKTNNLKILACTGLVTLASVVFYPMYDSFAKSSTKHLNQQGVSQIGDPRPEIAVDQTQVTPKINVAFVLDTTSSMGGLLEAAKQKIWSIASTMAAAQNQPELRIALVAFKDKGDAYRTKIIDFTKDLDRAYAELMEFTPHGGGDMAEDVNKALYDAVTRLSWLQSDKSYNAIFLVGDAPAKTYENEMQYPEIVKLAKYKNITINTIQCGENRYTQQEWSQIAQLGGGEFFQVDQNGGAVAVNTPYDKEIADLATKLENTRLSYGSSADIARHKEKVALADRVREESNTEAKARRGLFNISKSGSRNLLGEKDLVEDVMSGRADLSTVDKKHLPVPMQNMATSEVKAKLETVSKERKALKQKIAELGRQRKAYVSERLEESGDAENNLEAKLFSTLKKQTADKGIKYSDDALTY